MELTDHMASLRRHWLLIMVITAIALMLAEGASLMATPKYSARSVVYFSLPNGTSGLDLQAGSSYAQAQVESYAQLATTHDVLQPVIKKYSLPESPAALAGSLKVTVVQGTVMLSVVATSPSPAKAATLANAVAESLSDKVSALSPRNSADKASVTATKVTEATTPSVPSSPHTKRNLMAALFGGLLLGVVAAVLRDLTDTRIMSADDIKEITDSPILGQIGSRFSVEDGALAGNVYSPGMEEIRRVRTNLGFLGVEQRPLAVAITSAMPGEGKSTIAVSLARALGESGQSVLLIDGDLRRPEVGRMTDLEDSVGLTSVLIGDIEFDEAVQAWGSTGVDVLTAGVIPPNPSELLESLGMERLMKEARSRYDTIVIDTAPLVPVVETAALARMVSGYVLVARAGTVRSGDFRDALTTLENVSGRLYGVVMNDAAERRTKAYGYTAKESAPTPPSRRSGRKGNRGRKSESGLSRNRFTSRRIGALPDHAAARLTD